VSRQPTHHLHTQFRHRINAGRHAVLEQVRFFKAQFGQVASEWKADDTRVTFADFAISEKIMAELRQSFPGDDMCSEEMQVPDEVMDLNARFAWVLDPIDGTNNYALGIPMCGISLGLLRDGMPAYGFIYDFSRDVLLEGGAGEGLLENRKPITPAPQALDAQSLIALHFPMESATLERLRPVMERYRVRSFGSSALNLVYLALGRLAGLVDERVKVWDIAAGVALAEAAGLQVHYLGKSPFPLKSFTVDAAKVRYYAGNEAFCGMIHSR